MNGSRGRWPSRSPRAESVGRRALRAWGTASALLLIAATPLSARQPGVAIRTDAAVSMHAGRSYPTRVEITNTGTTPWTTRASLQIAYRWWTANGELAAGGRATHLPHDVAPGESLTLCESVVAPDQTGTMRLQWAVTEEGAAAATGPTSADDATRAVVVLPAGRFDTTWAIVRLTAFLLVTLGHFVLVAAWLGAFAPSGGWDADDFAFAWIAVGLGTFEAVLNTVAFTVGLSLERGLLAFTVAHLGVAAVWLARRRGHPAARPMVTTRLDATGRAPAVLLIAGAVIVLAIVMHWTVGATRSMQVTGADAAHYHVPYAVNIALGVNPIGLPATPHLYPMGTSMLAAWFILPFQDMLLVDLATLLPFLLAWFAIARLFREMSGRSGLTWGPWCALMLFSTPIFREGLLMSADLFYASAFLAVNAVLLKLCVRLRLETFDLLLLALTAGMLVGTKVTGTFSLVALAVVYGAILIGRTVMRGKPLERTGVGLASLGVAICVAVAAGGVWLMRNWWCFGSPLAPNGLSLFGMTIFPGGTYSEDMYHISVLSDIRDLPNYRIGARLLYWLREWFGTWFLLSAGLVAAFVVDLARAGKRGIGGSDAARARVMFAVASGVLLTAHLLLLAGVPWSSLEWTRGFALRYALPCFTLCVLIAYLALFPISLSNAPRRWRMWTRSLALLTIVWYVGHQGAPGVPTSESAGRLTPPSVVAALVLVGIALGVGRVERRTVRGAAVAGIVVLLAAGCAVYAVRNESAVRQIAEAAFDRMAVCNDGGNGRIDNYTGTYLALLAWERGTATACSNRRIFTTARWDFPLELQSPLVTNQVFDVRGQTVRSRMLRRARLGRPCDYVVASQAELLTTRGVPLLNLLKTRSNVQRVGEFGPYVVFAVR